MERKVLPYLVAISALSVSLSAAFYSVTGLSKMFAGASTQVMVMAGSLEIAKLIIASLLYQYWDKLGALLKIYLTIAVGILMLITSGGIYGYLSSAYSETSTKLEVMGKNVAVYDLKRERFQSQLNDVTVEKQSLNESILELTKGLSNNTIQYKDDEGNIITTTSSSTRRVLTKQLEDAKQQRDKLSIREEVLTDSVTKIDLINEAVKQLKKNYYDLRSKKVQNLINILNKKGFKKSTLGGCIFFKKGENLCLREEKL